MVDCCSARDIWWPQPTKKSHKCLISARYTDMERVFFLKMKQRSRPHHFGGGLSPKNQCQSLPQLSRRGWAPNQLILQRPTHDGKQPYQKSRILLLILCECRIFKKNTILPNNQLW
ncbi:hypothetical protein ES332_D10G236200v1 [Gossypium tomentosum]|uniref:Uncharacterized protein n=1 Tax=Gossypium tomentosum TaxID=34277 RepID=A0A5D2JA25_GOSTO|nr:hypothetical protein ES332_D10G236200v1 [Gossypium tomentosum]